MAMYRNPAVAGTFYPNNPAELNNMIESYLNESTTSDITPPKAIIAPHAGYIYSGPIAASIYNTLNPIKDKIQRVVLFGPAHRFAFQGIAGTNADYFVTPLGPIAVDLESMSFALKLPHVTCVEQAFSGEHCLEVQLPFLQKILHEFKIVPFIVGDADPKWVANVIDSLWGEDDTLIVISSDLSHYHPYHIAQKMDQATSNAIQHLQPEDIGYDQACGRIPIQGLLLVAKQKGLQVKMLDLRNSGDTSGPKDRVVGYGAYHFSVLEGQ